MSVDVDIPQPFNLNVNASGGIDFDLDDIHLNIDNLPTIALNAGLDLGGEVTLKSVSDLNVDVDVDLNGNVTTDSKVELNSDSKLDVGLDNIRIRELPEVKLEFGVRPMRFHFPLNFKWRLCLFGIELFKFETCGESMLVAENLEKHQSESCA